MASAQCFQRLRSSSEMITLNYACISHNGLQALSPCSISLKPETTLPDGYDSSLFFFFFCFLGLHSGHMEVPRLRVALELQPSAYTTATATWDLSHVCDLYHSSQPGWILNPLSEARDQTRNLTVTSRIHFHCATMGSLIPLRLLMRKWRGELTNLQC